MKDVFGLIVRVMGFALILFGVVGVGGLVLRLVGLSSHPEASAANGAAAAASYVIIGVAVVALAGPITRLVYGADRNSGQV